MKKNLFISIIFIVAILLISGCGDVEKNTTKDANEKEQTNDVGTVENSNEESSEDISNEASTDDKNNEEKSLKFDVASVEKELTSQALDVIKAYTIALETGDTSKFHAIVDDNVVDDDVSKRLIGVQRSKDDFDEYVDFQRKETGEQTLKKFITELKKATIDDIIPGDHSTYHDSVATMRYEFEPEGFVLSVDVSFSYNKLDNGEFVLNKISIN